MVELRGRNHRTCLGLKLWQWQPLYIHLMLNVADQRPHVRNIEPVDGVDRPRHPVRYSERKKGRAE